MFFAAVVKGCNSIHTEQSEPLNQGLAFLLVSECKCLDGGGCLRLAERSTRDEREAVVRLNDASFVFLSWSWEE